MLFLNTGLCSPGWPWTQGDPPASASWDARIRDVWLLLTRVWFLTPMPHPHSTFYFLPSLFLPSLLPPTVLGHTQINSLSPVDGYALVCQDRLQWRSRLLHLVPAQERLSTDAFQVVLLVGQAHTSIPELVTKKHRPALPQFCRFRV